MAIPPTVPTSFVPHPGNAPAPAPRSQLSNVFAIFSYALLGIAVVLAIAVFAYGYFLQSSKDAKDQQLAAAQSSIDSAAVENFVRLRNRLTSSNSLLNNHVAFSTFFSALEQILPANVRFNSLHLSVEDDGVVLEGVGAAKSFNALAAASSAFAADGRIKDAIFSHISVTVDNTVSFALSAKLDPKIVAFTPVAAPAAAEPTAPAASSTATSSPQTP